MCVDKLENKPYQTAMLDDYFPLSIEYLSYTN